MAPNSYRLVQTNLNMISKIAIFRALHLGDMLCIVPTVRSIRAAYPKAKIFLIGLPWQKEFSARFNRYFDEFIEFPGWPGLPEREYDREKIIDFLQAIGKYNFDIVFQMQGNGENTNAMCMLWNARQVCGLRKPDEYAPIDGFFPVSVDGEHEVLRFFKLLDCFGINSRGTDLEFPLTHEETSRAACMLDEVGLRRQQYICIHPGARDKRRRWPVDHFALIASEIATRGYPIVLTGAIQEKDILEQLQNKILSSTVNIVEAFGHVTAGELAAIIAGARLLVSNDTGVSHIASALRVPSVIIFSRFSDINRWRPLDAKKHVAVPFGESHDVANVWKRVVHLLEGEAPKINLPMER